MNQCTTWEALGSLPTPVLLIVNSPAERLAEIEAIVRMLGSVVSLGDVRVIAPVATVAATTALGIPAAHIRAATVHGSELELNFFLEHEHAFEWVAKHRPRTVVGSAPHNLYNEEVKELFESRVLMFLGGARLLAHALPVRFLYQLTAADLVERTTRPAKLAAYRRLADALLADFHAQWLATGTPAQDDTPDYRDVAETFTRHLGREVLTFDEQSRIPTPIAAVPAPDLIARVRRARLRQFIRQVRIRFS